MSDESSPLPSNEGTTRLNDQEDSADYSLKVLSEQDVEKVVNKWRRRNRLKKRLVIGLTVTTGILLLIAIGILLAILLLQSKSGGNCSCSKTTISNSTYRARGGGGTNSSDSDNSTSLAESLMNMVAAPYSDCGSRYGTIDAFFAEDCIIDGDRCRFNREATGRLDISFTVSQAFEKLTVKATGVADTLQFLKVVQNVVPVNACESLKCPLQRNKQYSILLTQTPPMDMLFWIKSQKDVKTTVKYELLDDSGTSAICLSLQIILI